MCKDGQKPAEDAGRNTETAPGGPPVAEDLAGEFFSGSVQAAARIITLAENRDPVFFELMKLIYPHTGKAYVVGITGAPGTGKSTLTDAFAALLRERNFTVGIIAVDPSSPFAGGALLGDRIRMQRLCLDPGVFIRSTATRGQLGGLARTTGSIVKILDAFGKDFIIVETVGAGQDEVDIAGTADTTLLVLAPGSGDAIQNMKAGIMEIADIYAINMADREGVDRLFNQVKIRADQDFELRKNAWKAPILLTAAIHNEGIVELVDAVESHRHYLMKNGRMQKLRREKTKSEILRLLKEEITEHILDHFLGEGMFDELIDEVASRRKDPYTGVREIVHTILPGHA
ncbi:MAG: methylmalonyl Co-A mutase-associated GTPase MeaB [Acidobacteriota bacterium]|jgi:LAO/AO transport system kinase